jgi:hypothetical protein
MTHPTITHRDATFSPDRRYRYRLDRTWDPTKPTAVVIGINPSVADEETDDPTITFLVRCLANWGYGHLVMVNLFALVSTDPQGLETAVDPIGPDCDHHIARAVAEADGVFVGWGAPNRFRASRQVFVALALAGRELWCVGKTAAGYPRHPSRMSYPAAPILYQAKQG